MAKSVYLFEIWDNKFSTTEKHLGGIYKIYFENFPEHSYLGMTSAKVGFQKKISEIQKALWTTFIGCQQISVNEEIEEWYLTQNEYRKLNFEQRQKYDQLISEKRKLKIEEYENDLYQTGESKYLKMLVFMEMKNLTLKDLRFEILKRTEWGLNEDLFNLKSQLIEKSQNYIQGFNSVLALSYGYYRDNEPIDVEILKRMKKIILENQEDHYPQWNCWQSLYQVFKTSFLKNIYGWMNFWKMISFAELKENFSDFTRLLYQMNLDTKMINGHDFPISTVEELLKYKNLNVDFLFSKRKLKTVKERIEIEEWIENDWQYFFDSWQSLDSEDQSLYQFFGSWEEIKSFFKKNPFQNTKGIDSSLTVKINDFLDSYEKLNEPMIALKIYQKIHQEIDFEWYWANYQDDNYFDDEDYFEERPIDPRQNQKFNFNLIFDFYFAKNFLNSLVFKNLNFTR